VSGRTGARGGINACKNNFGEETERKKILGKSTCRWKVEIKKKLKGTE
jgi:hypothetical protein